MARSNITDYLRDYPFWLFDVPTMETAALPIFTPLSGFSSISAPEMTFETEAVTEGNWFFKHHVIKRAEVNSITLSRGVTLGNADFYTWAMNALTSTQAASLNLASLFGSGPISPRRQLVLVHFFSHLPIPLDQTAVGGAAAAALGNLAGSAGAMSAAALLGGGGFNFALRIPARAYVLTGCIPTRYKAGSDFDATSGAVSISELDVSYEFFEQFSLLGR